MVHLLSANRRFLVVPRCRLSRLGPRAFSGPARRFGLSTRQLKRSGPWQGQLQTSAEDAFIYTALKHLLY